MERLDVVGLLGVLQELERNVSISLMYSGLRLPQYRLLDQLARSGPATVTDVSRVMGITRATASVQINELVRNGLLAMVENPTDRRSFHVHLTDGGVQKLKVARSDLSVFMDKLAARYPPETVRHVNTFVMEVRNERSQSTRAVPNDELNPR